MSLANTQALFWSAATGSPAQDPSSFLNGTAELAASERIGIYAEMFIWRQLETLREDFPKLWALMGEDPFESTARDYLQSHPSRHPSLSKLGRELPDFLRRSQLLRSDLADLASLEWARAEVFEALDAPVMDSQALAALPPDELAEMKLEPISAWQLLRLDHDILPLWRALEEGRPADVGAPKLGDNCAVVWRKGFDVFHVAVNRNEALALDSLLAGAPPGHDLRSLQRPAGARRRGFRCNLKLVKRRVDIPMKLSTPLSLLTRTGWLPPAAAAVVCGVPVCRVGLGEGA